MEPREQRPKSMSEFFAISVDKFRGGKHCQFQVLGSDIDKSMKIAWAARAVKTVKALKKFEHLIPPTIRQHYFNIVAGGTGYEGYRRGVANIASARWDWQVQVSRAIGGNNTGQLPI